jgi:hypothetical protein
MNSINVFRQQFRQGLQHVNHTSNQAFRALCCRSIDTINLSDQQNTNRLHEIQAPQISYQVISDSTPHSADPQQGSIATPPPAPSTAPLDLDTLQLDSSSNPSLASTNNPTLLSCG